jgi:tRNA dimethylallyltransferase
MKKVIIITGPTAVGKTKLSIKLAHLLKTEIISGDAYQIYRNMNIGTAKPTMAEREGIIHHLMDIIDPSESYSVADYQAQVRSKINDLTSRNLIPLIVGGSGLYIDSVIFDYQFNAPSRNQEIESRFSGLDNESLHQHLASLDAEAARNIHPNNRKRVLRAIELADSGYNYHHNKDRTKRLYQALIFFLNDDRTTLYHQINARVDEMMKQGLLEEAEKIFHQPLSIQAAKTMGYQELFPYFKGEITLEEAVDQIKKNTRRYAKRQLTWFRNRDDVIQVMINRENFDETINFVYQKSLSFIKGEKL